MPVKFLQQVILLKSIPRSGWIPHGISLADVESVADHSYSVSMISMIMCDYLQERGQKLDAEKVLRMAILHDISEVLTFDISKQYIEYLGRRGRNLKQLLEEKASREVLRKLSNLDIARDQSSILEEYSVGRTLEARVVHAADGLDILLQILSYENTGYPARLLDPLWKETVKRGQSLGISFVDRMLAKLDRERRSGRRP